MKARVNGIATLLPSNYRSSYCCACGTHLAGGSNKYATLHPARRGPRYVLESGHDRHERLRRLL